MDISYSNYGTKIDAITTCVADRFPVTNCPSMPNKVQCKVE